MTNTIQQTGAGNASRIGTTLLTRYDWNGNFDSIEWAFNIHVKCQDASNFNVAILHGNEDSPERIEFFQSEDVMISDVPEFTWVPIA